jgi:uncharacterized protein (DUF58 family)
MTNISSQIRSRGNAPIFLFLILILTILTIIDDYQGWRLLLIGLVVALVVAKRWSHSLAENIHIDREIRFGWAQVGDRLEQHFTLINDSPFPAVWLELEDHSNLPGYKADRATGIGGKNLNRWRMRGICQQRGLFRLGPTTLHSSDPLGLFQIKVHDTSHINLLVTPPVIALPQIEVAPGGRAGEGRLRPYAQEKTVSSSGTRPYLPGDSMHQIHWRTTARKDAIHVHRFENRPSGDWWILLDSDELVQVGEGPKSTIEHSVILAASLADRGLSLGRAVGLAAMGDRLMWLTPKQGEGRRWEILEALALLKPGNLPLSKLISLLEPKLSANSSLVIITPTSSDDWLHSLLPLVWKGATPTILLLDRSSFEETGPPTKATTELINWGIHYEVITADLLDRPDTRPGHKGEYNWSITPTGKAILTKPPVGTSWRGIQ